MSVIAMLLFCVPRGDEMDSYSTTAQVGVEA